MTGVGNVRAWPKWTHPVGKLFDQPSHAAEDLHSIPGCSRLAWMNVVKFRTKRNGAVQQKAVQHSIDSHFRREMEVLRPRAVVSVGRAAERALDAVYLPGEPIRGHLNLRCPSNVEVKALQMLLHRGGVYI